MAMCNCVGPQNGEPMCPCMMSGVAVRDGHYVLERDLGPVTPKRRSLFHDFKFCPHCGQSLDVPYVEHACEERV